MVVMSSYNVEETIATMLKNMQSKYSMSINNVKIIMLSSIHDHDFISYLDITADIDLISQN